MAGRLASSCTAARKASPRASKSVNWSKDAQAGDSSTMASPPAAAAGASEPAGAPAGGGRVGGGAGGGGLDVAALDHRRPALQRLAEGGRGLADQIGLG